MRPAATFLLSIRYLFAKGPGRALSFKRIRGGIVGIALSLVPLVLVYQVANGMIQGISARYIEAGTYHLQAVSYNGSASQRIDPDAVTAIRAIPGVRWAAPELQGMALASSRNESTAVSIRAVPPELANEAGFKTFVTVREGAFNLADHQSAVIGTEVARMLKIGVGDQLRIVTARNVTGESLLPRISSFRVTGIISSGYQELDKLWVFINLERGRKILPKGASREVLAIKVDQPYSLPNPLFSGDPGGISPDALTTAVAPTVGATPAANDIGLDAPIDDETNSTENKTGTPGGSEGKRYQPKVEPGEPITTSMLRTLGSGWRVYTWFELMRPQYLNFVSTRNVLLIIMLLIVLVASVNVSSSMIMLVMEKQQEIAILKSIGARPGALAMVFVIAGGVTGAFGAIIGVGLGALLALRINELLIALEWIINACGALIWQIGGQASGRPYDALQIINPEFYLERIPIDIHFSDLTMMVVVTIMLSMIVSLFPALRAARLRPLQIFQKV